MPNISKDVIEAAQASMKKWEIPASLTLAQYGIESAWGTKTSGKNNFFGIKGNGSDVLTHEYVAGKSVAEKLSFKDYPTVAACFDDHGRILRTLPAYEYARSYLPDPIQFGHALTGVYATAPNYGTVLEGIIKGDGLEKYDSVS